MAVFTRLSQFQVGDDAGAPVSCGWPDLGGIGLAGRDVCLKLSPAGLRCTSAALALDRVVAYFCPMWPRPRCGVG